VSNFAGGLQLGPARPACRSASAGPARAWGASGHQTRPIPSWPGTGPRIQGQGAGAGAPYHFPRPPALPGAAAGELLRARRSARSAWRNHGNMLWLDNEAGGGSSPGRRGRLRARLHGQAWCRCARHNPCGVYSFWSFITSGNCAGLGSYPLWLALFQSATPPRRPGAVEGVEVLAVGRGRVTATNDVFNGDRPPRLNAWISSFQPNVEVRKCSQAQLNTGANAVTVDHGAGTGRRQPTSRFGLRQRPPGPAPCGRCGWRFLRHPVAHHETA